MINVQKITAIIPISQALLDDLKPPTPEQAAEYARRAAEYQEARKQALKRHIHLMGTTTGLRRAVLELHGPATVSYRRAEVCLGCDLDGYDAEPPDWPCRTYTLAVSAEEAT